jgi:hypothetical protein
MYNNLILFLYIIHGEKMEKSVLEREYLIENKSVKQITDIYGIKEHTIRYLISKYGLRKQAFTKDLTNERFGYLVAISKTNVIYGDGHNRIAWECECDCGNKKTIVQQSLTRGLTKSCGCYFQKHIFKGYKNFGGQQWSRIKHQAKQRNIEFDITIEYAYDLFEKQNNKCAISGVEIKLNKNYEGKKSLNSASLDRINSDIGYIVGNVQWVHKRVNMMKNNMSEKEFYEWCRIISEYNCIKR